MPKQQLTTVASCCSSQGPAGQCSSPYADIRGTKAGMPRLAGRNSALATLLSLPWCCVLPALLSFVSLSSAIAAGVWLVKLTWVFLPLGVLLLGRAFWLLYIKHQGGRWSRLLTWAATLLVFILWAPRLWAWISW